MKGTYLFAITVVLLVGLQLYQPTLAQNQTAQNQTNPPEPPKNKTPSTNDTISTNDNDTISTNDIIQSLFDKSPPALFVSIIAVVVVIPVLFDMYLAYRRRPQEGTGKEGTRRPVGMAGLYRTLMSFGVILVLGTVIFYLLGLLTLNVTITDGNSTALTSLVDLLRNLGTILGTAVATIIAFYFGGRGAESAVEKAAAPKAGEKVPAEVKSTSPIEGATGVPVTSLVLVTFSEPMNKETINDATFTVKKQGETNSVTGKIDLTPDNKTATFDADPDFVTGTKYEVTIDIGAQTLTGDKLASAKRWSFTTESGTGSNDDVDDDSPS